MVVPNGDQCIVVCDAGLAFHVVDDSDVARQNLCIDTVMHELCHVYDQGRRRRLLGHELPRIPLKPLQGHVFNAADSAYAEYFANRYSHSSCSSPDMHPKNLAEVVPLVARDIRAALEAFNAEPRVEELLAVCRAKVRFLFQCFGYAAGRLFALEATLADVAAGSVDVLRAAGIYETWLAVHAELDRLDECRESWSSFQELSRLMALADSVYRHFGVVTSEGPNGLRLDLTEPEGSA